MRRTLLPLLLPFACAAIAACGGDSSSDDGVRSVDTSTLPRAGDRVAPGNNGVEAVIVMRDNAFAPPLVLIELGTKVTWVNDDDVEHDVRSTSGEKVDSPLFGRGEGYSFRPTRAGAIEYVCTVHPRMTGRIQVEPRA